jgi:hypothetical protein
MPRSFQWSLSPSVPPTKNHVHISHFSHISHMPCTHHVLLNLIIQIMSDEDYNRWSSSLCNFLQSPPTSSNLGPTYSAPYLWTPVNKHWQQYIFKHHSNYNAPSDLILKNLSFCVHSLFMWTPVNGSNTSFKHHSNYNAPSDWIQKNLAFCAQSLFMCTVWLSK